MYTIALEIVLLKSALFEKILQNALAEQKIFGRTNINLSPISYSKYNNSKKTTTIKDVQQREQQQQ